MNYLYNNNNNDSGFLYSVLSLTCSKRFTHITPSLVTSKRVIHKPIMVYSAGYSAGYNSVFAPCQAQRHYHSHIQSINCRVPNLSPGWGEICGQRFKPPINLS